MCSGARGWSPSLRRRCFLWEQRAGSPQPCRFFSPKDGSQQLRAAGRREGCAPAGTRGRGQDILFRRGTWGRGEDPGLWEPRGRQHPSRAQPNHSHWKTPNEAKSPLREEDAPGPDTLGMSRAPTPAPARCSAAPRPRSWTRQSLASHPERTGNTVAQLRDTNPRAFNSSHCDWKHFVTNSLRRTRTTFLTVMYQLNWTI